MIANNAKFIKLLHLPVKYVYNHVTYYNVMHIGHRILHIIQLGILLDSMFINRAQYSQQCGTNYVK